MEIKKSFAELKSLRDKMISEENKRNQASLIKRKLEIENKRVEEIQFRKDHPELICGWCNGSGVTSNQGADVCCSFCGGTGRSYGY